MASIETEVTIDVDVDLVCSVCGNGLVVGKSCSCRLEIVPCENCIAKIAEKSICEKKDTLVR